MQLPEPLDASELLVRAEREKVTYLPGRLFAISHTDPGALRLSFGGLAPAIIESGMATLGRIFTQETARMRSGELLEAAPAMV